MRTSTKSIVHAAQDGGYAVGAFNIFDGLTLRAVVRAAGEKRSPAIVQVSARTAKALAGRTGPAMADAMAPPPPQDINRIGRSAPEDEAVPGARS